MADITAQKEIVTPKICITDDNEPSNNADDDVDLHKVKEVSAKLKLQTRRPSLLQWKAIIESRKADGSLFGLNRHECNNDQGTLNNDVTTTAAACTMTSSALNDSHHLLHAVKEEVVVDSTDDQADEFQDVSDRYREVTRKLQIIKSDLVLMRIKDNELAGKLLTIRRDINVIKAQNSCAKVANMLDDVTWEMEEEGELTGLYKACDLSDGKPTTLLSTFTDLRQIGVHRMNLNRRRFSIR